MLDSVVDIQCSARQWLASQRLTELWVEMDRNHRLLQAVLLCQSLVRRNRAMRRYSVLHIRVHDIESAIVIQASFRRYSALISLCQGKEGAIKIQSIVRMHIGRISYLSIKSAAVFVQSRFRWVVVRNIYLGKKMAVARIQSQAMEESDIRILAANKMQL